MKLRIAWIGKTKDAAVQSLTAEYLQRLSRYVATESLEIATEAALLKQLDKSRGSLIRLDSRGRQLSSEPFAEFLRQHQDRGTPSLLFAVGGADGFS
ncbi:MAG: 23S rRNA (pseudouridine(1915)-N(3))-methyltransferase RlmH, partial [Terriglobales bacterium]